VRWENIYKALVLAAATNDEGVLGNNIYVADHVPQVGRLKLGIAQPVY